MPQPPTPEQLRARRRAALRARQIRRRRVVAGVVAVALGGGAAFAITALSDDDGQSEDPGGGLATALGPEASGGLSPAQLAGQRLVAGFSGKKAPKGLRRMIARGRIAGVILFDENVDGPGQARRLVRSMQRIGRPRGLGMPLAVMVDQEGGLVKRIEGPPDASAEQMGRRGRGYARRQGSATARNLRRHGINVDLAPVLDVARPGGAIDGEQRSFGRTPARVIAAGVDGFAAGLRRGGVVATAKHYPGLGAADVNTDEASQEIDLPRRRLRAIDERPFEAFAADGGRLIMLSLATYTSFSDRPAAMSRSIVRGELRRRLGFDGVTITDSLDAAAATSLGGRDRVAIQAAKAGSDLLLYGDWRTARDIARPLRRALARGKLDKREFEASVARVLDLRRSLGS